MRTLKYDAAVFEEGCGRIYRRIMNLTLPGLLLAVIEIALINTGILQMEKVSPVILKLVVVLTVLYVIPSIFIFPTAWFLSYGRSRLCRSATIDIYKKKIVYHKVVSMTMGTPRFVDYSVTQLRRIEEKRGSWILHGTVTNDTSGGNQNTLEIPLAFEDMHLLRGTARYR